MSRQIKNISMFFFIMTTLAACSVSPSRQATQWQDHQQSLQEITDFTVKGKVAFIDPNQRISASFVWQQKQDEMVLNISNFFGNTLFKLTVTPHYARLIDADAKQYTGVNGAQLLKELTSIDLPINEMSQWIKGLPTKNNSYTLGQDNRLASLSQFNLTSENKGWQLDYLSYDPNTQDLLPSKITMHQNEQKVKLVISEWIYN